MGPALSLSSLLLSLDTAVPALAPRAGVCVGLISSGCVSHHSGSFTGLQAAPGAGRPSGCPGRLLLWAVQNKAGLHPLTATPLPPVASGVLPGDALRSKKKAGFWRWPVVTLDPASQGRLEAANGSTE